MKKNEVIEIDVKNAIALCHIVNEYEEFLEKLDKLLYGSKKSNEFVFYNTIEVLEKISQGKPVLFNKKVKQFYNDNKTVIDKINKYSSIVNFILSNSKEDIKAFYQYIFKNKDKIDEMIILLEKIKELGLTQIELGEKIDFSMNVYSLTTDFRFNSSVEYLDNMEVIPTYDSYKVRYITNDSNYKIDATSSYYKKIVLNSLTFNPDRLPNNVAKRLLFDEIIALTELQKQEIKLIKNSVNLSIGIDDLTLALLDFEKVIDKLEDVKSEESLKSLLEKIKEDATRIKKLSLQYDTDIIGQSEYITSDILEKEKKDEKTRRYNMGIDLC